MIKAIIWDMDGVLINSEPYHIQAEIKTFRRYKIRLTSPIAKEYFGLRTIDYFKALSRRFRIDLPIDKMLKEHRKNLEFYFKNIIPLTLHAKETLRVLHNYYSMGLATSTIKALAELVLGKYSLLSYFAIEVYGDEVKYGKPNPEVFLKTAFRLRVHPHDCVVIEDATNGIEAARKAQMKVIAYKSRHNTKEDFSRADDIVGDLSDIPERLKKL